MLGFKRALVGVLQLLWAIKLQQFLKFSFHPVCCIFGSVTASFNSMGLGMGVGNTSL